MQHFPGNSLPLNIKLEEVQAMVEEELGEQAWKDAQIKSTKLELCPYYTFVFDTYSEEEESNTKIKNVAENVHGKSSLNAVKNELDEVIAEMVDPETIQAEFSVANTVTVEQKKPRFPAEDAKSVAQIKIAAQEHVPRANVHISGLQLVYVPFWVAKVELEEENEVKLRINGFTGEFENENPVEYRGKSPTELVGETLSDLRSPSNWVEYIISILKDIGDVILKPDAEHPNRRMVIFILIVIAIILLAIGFVKLPVPH
ncbi:MAG: hypothetical protein IPJ89_01395 [Candidatus Iainarchaeum archaeon]|uniref:Uncharacterized protein n=1 Tax=Candidatus Iainarchaeum sp. TaxID=3101447 RepID=A0A7T9DKA0_9ARCH|nr:MAG: hypothetical protein IPJ89_01395 [Candidatus Diapherotrites archaeon]